MGSYSFISGCAGLALSEAERHFFRAAQPWGLILFARNIDRPEQVRALVKQFRDEVGWNAPVFVDQEGGRVQRLRSPHWTEFPPARTYGELYDRDKDKGIAAAYLGAALMGSELIALGINVDCLPVLDLLFPAAHQVIGKRSYGSDPQTVASLGRAAAFGLMDVGVLPVMKHMPGHGRTSVDTHETLPTVTASLEELRATDFKPFEALADLPLGMTGHLIFSALDPARPATLSKTIISHVIRGEIGFAGALISDDMSMGALSGSLTERCAQILNAGCDLVLHCNGTLSEMEEVAANLPALAGEPLRRTDLALEALGQTPGFDVAEGRRRYADLMQDMEWSSGAA